MLTADEARAALTGPGGPFETGHEIVLGRPTLVYRNRMRSLAEVLDAGHDRGDADIYVASGRRQIGFATFAEWAYGIAHRLRESGVEDGDRVAILAQNCPEWLLAFWGAIAAGAVAVGLNSWWKPDELVYGLQDSGAKVLVVDRKRLDLLAAHLHRCESLQLVVLIDGEVPLDAGTHVEIRDFGDLVEHGRAFAPSSKVTEDSPATILYTSGTTGRPKGAVSSHRNVIAGVQNTLFLARLNSMTMSREGRPRVPTVSLFTSPLFHVSGLHSTAVVGLLAGVRLVMLQGRFTPERALQLIEEERVTVWATVPTLVWRVCEYPGRKDFDTSSVRSVSYGGSASGAELRRKVRETFPNVKAPSNGYGLTETSSPVAVLSPFDGNQRGDSVGQPLPTVQVRIVDEAESDLAFGVVGDILVASPTVMLGYWGKDAETAQAITPDGWLRTGDVGYLDADGYLYVTDRKKDIIIRGGENVYCVEVENRLMEHPEIHDAAVIGIPHHQLGEEVLAVVQTPEESTLEAEDVRKWVADALADFKVPAYVEFRTTNLPRTATGKVIKSELRNPGGLS